MSVMYDTEEYYSLKPADRVSETPNERRSKYYHHHESRTDENGVSPCPHSWELQFICIQ